jgi:DNA helicase IV
MTVVGDIAQSTGAWAHASWDEIRGRLPDRRPARQVELTIGYRIPAPNMALAARVLAEAAPELSPPRSIRQEGREPKFVAVPAGEGLGEAVVRAVTAELDGIGHGNVAVISPRSLVDDMVAALRTAGVEHGLAPSQGLDHQVTVVPVTVVKGLELDATVVVEPAVILDEEPQGLRSLYVALTRATKRLTVVHARPRPEVIS